MVHYLQFDREAETGASFDNRNLLLIVLLFFGTGYCPEVLFKKRYSVGKVCWA